MKDQYVGDQNDYAKYQLLRRCAGIFEEVIVAWMLTAPDGGSDGGKLAYLSEPALRRADPWLYDRLGELVGSGERSVAAVAGAGILPGASFDAALLPSSPPARAAYFDAIATRASVDSLVFFDPDNGLEVTSVKPGSGAAVKYLFWAELAAVAASGASLAIYQHFPRVARAAYVEALLTRLGSELGPEYETCAAHTSQVAFLFATRAPQAAELHATLAECCAAFGPLSLVEG